MSPQNPQKIKLISAYYKLKGFLCLLPPGCGGVKLRKSVTVQKWWNRKQSICWGRASLVTTGSRNLQMHPSSVLSKHLNFLSAKRLVSLFSESQQNKRVNKSMTLKKVKILWKIDLQLGLISSPTKYAKWRLSNSFLSGLVFHVKIQH